jgi:hypothetical protein
MSIVPNSRVGKIEFYEAHLTPWTDNAVAIGLTAAQASELMTKTKAARTSYDNAQMARDAAKAATEVFYARVRDMHDLGAGLIETIKNKARMTNDEGVYALAQIPSPAAPSPVGPPGTPYDFTLTLQQSGVLELRWKCSNPEGAGGTIYEVMRRTGTSTAAPFAFIGATGTRTFLDETLVAGSTGVTYQITAVRSTRRGNPAQFNVNFGVVGGGGGFYVASVTDANGQPMKMAA